MYLNGTAWLSPTDTLRERTSHWDSSHHDHALDSSSGTSTSRCPGIWRNPRSHRLRWTANVCGQKAQQAMDMNSRSSQASRNSGMGNWASQCPNLQTLVAHRPVLELFLLCYWRVESLSDVHRWGGSDCEQDLYDSGGREEYSLAALPGATPP